VVRQLHPRNGGKKVHMQMAKSANIRAEHVTWSESKFTRRIHFVIKRAYFSLSTQHYTEEE